MGAAEPPGDWVAALRGPGAGRDDAVARLHETLLRVARSELHRRHGQLNVAGPELDDLAHQAAADAMLAILAKLDQFRGESKFTTWAYKFVMFEVSAKVGRHFWRNPPVALATEDWDRLPDRFGFDPAGESERRDFVLDGVPLDALADKLGSSRNAIYKTMFDTRRKLRASLVANGYLHDEVVRRP
jgi:RNA polymerase sigma-70 factor, ECF subfamily